MTKWEYLIMPFGNADRTTIGRKLDELGAKGWEVIHVRCTPGAHAREDIEVWMKRPAASADSVTKG